VFTYIHKALFERNGRSVCECAEMTKLVLA